VTTTEPQKPSSSPGFVPSELFHMGRGALDDSRRWFPETADSVAFTVLALAGEVGEVANIVKKLERKSLRWTDAKVRMDLHMEVADVFTYLILLAGQLNVDLVKLYDLKRVEN
jgi:NTP pyrophosphatase (non-canonical NTP hydrolase)